MSLPLHTLIARMQQQLQQERLDPQLLVDWVDRLRPDQADDQGQIHRRIQRMVQQLVLIPVSAEVLQRFILRLLNQYRQMNLYASSGILSSGGFNMQLSQRIGEHFLPLLKDEDELRHLVGAIFYKKSDRYWLENISHKDWQALLGLLCTPNANQRNKLQIRMQMLNAVMVLSYRISSIGLHPELIHAFPEINEYASPFLMQNREIIEFIETYKTYVANYRVTSVVPLPDPAQALVMLDQCSDIMRRIRRGTRRSGVSFSLTYLLILLEQCLDRIESLLKLLTTHDQAQQEEMASLIRRLVRGHYDDKSVRALVATNSELVALQITENASRTGEHYVSTDKRGFVAMYYRAAGAGAIIAVMATIKILISKLHMAPLLQAAMYSLNYGLGFVLIHILRFTVATKQPAMTAAALAATIQNSRGTRMEQLSGLAALIINIIRTQFVAILGNISIAMPVAAVIVLSWPLLFGEPMINNAKAVHLLHDLNPFQSLAVFHAAIAGVCLFFSGLIAGYYDNLAVYGHIGPRIKAHPRLQRWIGQQRLNRIGDYVENNLGAIMGNFLFGCMLGSIGTIGYMLGLPLDIRHIAFASANYIQGLMHVAGGPDLEMIIVCLLGVLLIGLINLFVSFSLTIFVALRARRVQIRHWKPLFKLIMTHFVTRPSDFFWPPRQPLALGEKPAKSADSASNS